MPEESKLTEKLEQKQSEVKFTEDELKKLQEIQKAYVDIQVGFGQTRIAEIKLRGQLEELDQYGEALTSKFIENQQLEKEFITQITEKYGDGVLNPQTGEYILSENQKK